MSWKEQFDKKWIGWLYDEEPARKAVQDFISTEIIEALIADIPDSIPLSWQNRYEGERPMYGFKQELKDKWL